MSVEANEKQTKMGNIFISFHMNNHFYETNNANCLCLYVEKLSDLLEKTSAYSKFLGGMLTKNTYDIVHEDDAAKTTSTSAVATVAVRCRAVQT